MSFMPMDEGMKGAFAQIKNGTAFDRSFETSVISTEGRIAGVQTKASSIPSAMNGVPESILSKAKNIETQITSAAARIPAFAQHVAKQFNDLPNNIGTFASSQGLKNAVSGKSEGCSNLSDFFGSITTTGPQAIGLINQLVDEVTVEIDRFKNLGTTLQGNITASYDEIVNQLNAEIASAGADATRIADLNAVKDNLALNFRDGLDEARASLADLAKDKLSEAGKGIVDPLIRQMKLTDLDLQGSATRISGFAGEIEINSQGLQDMIDKEVETLDGAVTELETLGQASGMRSLLQTNPCVQTLMGFVGETSFLKNLKGS